MEDYLTFGKKDSQTRMRSENNLKRGTICENPLRVSSRVPKTVRHGTSLHRTCPKLLIDLRPSRLESIDSSPSRLESQTSVRWLTVKIFGLSPVRLDSQASVCQPMLKQFGSSPSQLESAASVRRPLLKPFGSSPRRLSFDQRKNC